MTHTIVCYINDVIFCNIYSISWYKPENEYINGINISYQIYFIYYWPTISRYYFVITDQMNEISENCNLCNKPNDQMLMLSCVHDPCINCAASAYAEQIHIKGQSKEVNKLVFSSISVKYAEKKHY